MGIVLGCQVFYFRKNRPGHRGFFIESGIFTNILYYINNTLFARFQIMLGKRMFL